MPSPRRWTIVTLAPSLLCRGTAAASGRFASAPAGVGAAPLGQAAGRAAARIVRTRQGRESRAVLANSRPGPGRRRGLHKPRRPSRGAVGSFG